MMGIEERICDLTVLAQRCQKWRDEGKKVVFTNGVFDLVHRGHVTYLDAAAQWGDVLVVGINGDASVRRLGKGADRPIVAEQDRAFVVAGLRPVEAVVLFGEDTPLNLVRALRPDVLVKGGDYDAECRDMDHPRYIVGSEEVRANGGRVVTIDLVPGRSTTSIANKLKGQ